MTDRNPAAPDAPGWWWRNGSAYQVWAAHDGVLRWCLDAPTTHDSKTDPQPGDALIGSRGGRRWVQARGLDSVTWHDDRGRVHTQRLADFLTWARRARVHRAADDHDEPTSPAGKVSLCQMCGGTGVVVRGRHGYERAHGCIDCSDGLQSDAQRRRGMRELRRSRR